MSLNQWLILAVLAVGVILIFSALLIMVDIFGLRVPVIQFVPTTATLTPTQTPTRRPSPTATATWTRVPTIAPTNPPSNLKTNSSAPGKTTPRPPGKASATVPRGPSPTATMRATLPPTPTPVPSQSNPDVRFVSVSVTHPGSDAQVVIKTIAGTACSLLFISTTGEFLAPSTASTKADANGNLTWTWKIPDDAKPGQGKVAVTCGTVTIESSLTVEQ